jgi:hypothetical protein
LKTWVTDERELFYNISKSLVSISKKHMSRVLTIEMPEIGYCISSKGEVHGELIGTRNETTRKYQHAPRKYHFHYDKTSLFKTETPGGSTSVI